MPTKSLIGRAAKSVFALPPLMFVLATSAPARATDGSMYVEAAGGPDGQGGCPAPGANQVQIFAGGTNGNAMEIFATVYNNGCDPGNQKIAQTFFVQPGETGGIPALDSFGNLSNYMLDLGEAQQCGVTYCYYSCDCGALEGISCIENGKCTNATSAGVTPTPSPAAACCGCQASC
jgi:hypothetical protein